MRSHRRRLHATDLFTNELRRSKYAYPGSRRRARYVSSSGGAAGSRDPPLRRRAVTCSLNALSALSAAQGTCEAQGLIGLCFANTVRET